MKKVSYLIVFIVSLFIFNARVDAASVTIKSNKSNIVVGNSVTVTVTYYSGNDIGQATGTVTYNNKILQLTSGTLAIDYSAPEGGISSKSYTYTFKAIGSGSTTVSIANPKIYEMKGTTVGAVTPSVSNSTIKVITQSQLEDSYSKNNYLKTLEVSGYSLPFNKDTMEYTLEVENSVEKLTINATKEDSSATISGTGEIALSEGVNSIEIAVTAQNGNVRTYKLSVTRKELDPIQITVGGKAYTVIRKKEFMPKSSSYFYESTTTIEDKEIPSYYNEMTEFTLVGLKDEAGNTSLFLYKDGVYQKYQEFSFNQLSIYLEDVGDISIPKGYSKTTTTIDNQQVTAYKNDHSAYPLLYGMNLGNGEKGFYQYDSKENTLQRYQETDDNEKQLYFYCCIGLVSFLVLTYIIIIICLLKNKSKKVKKFETAVQLKKVEVQDDLEKTQKLNDLLQQYGGIEKPTKEEKLKIKQQAALEEEAKKQMHQEFLQDEEKKSKKELKQQDKREREKLKEAAKRVELEQKQTKKDLKKKKLSKKQQQALLGKTMIDITGISFERKDDKK